MDALPEPTRLSTNVETHPLVQAAKALQPKLRDDRESIETNQRLPQPLVEQLHEAGFYRLVIPRVLGGHQLDPITFTRIVEVLAQGVGSVGWNIANCGIGQLASLGLPDEGVQEIYGRNPSTVMAGTAIQGGGTATRVPGGYNVTGHWSFGSGTQESLWMLGSFQVVNEDGKPNRRPDGAVHYMRGVFRKEETELVPDSWDTAGMRGTGSFDWKVTNTFLPDHRSTDHIGAPLDNQWSRWPGLAYALPSFAWVGPHHSSVITGIARAGIEALIELAGGKTPRGRPPGLLCENPQVQDAVGRADTVLNAARAYRSAMIAEVWETIAQGQDSTLEQRARLRLAASNAADSARYAMDLMYRHGGSTSFKRQSRLAECWRDAQVVGQTANVAPEWYPIGGRLLLGMDPGPRLR
jgi:hypothetical protein